MERVLNQEPVRVVTHRHLEEVVTALVALLSQLAAIMEHAQVKNLFELMSDICILTKNRWNSGITKGGIANDFLNNIDFLSIFSDFLS